VAAVAEGPAHRKAIALAGAGALLAGCLTAGGWLELALTHAHNVIGIALWWVLRRRSPRELAPLALLVASSIAIAAGAFDPMVEGLGVPGFGASLHHHGLVLAPRVDATWAVRVAVLFAFLQGVHYVVWLRLVPEDARERPAPRPFASTWRALVVDL